MNLFKFQSKYLTIFESLPIIMQEFWITNPCFIHSSLLERNNFQHRLIQAGTTDNYQTGTFAKAIKFNPALLITVLIELIYDIYYRKLHFSHGFFTEFY